MSEQRVLIAVEARSEAEVVRVLREVLGPAFFDESLPDVAGFRIEVMDATEASSYAAEFTKRTGVEDDSAVWREFDSSRFLVDVVLSALSGSIASACLDLVGDVLAQRLSQTLSTRTVLSIGDGYVPFGVYSGGARIRFYREEVRAELATTAWLPRELL